MPNMPVAIALASLRSESGEKPEQETHVPKFSRRKEQRRLKAWWKWRPPERKGRTPDGGCRTNGPRKGERVGSARESELGPAPPPPAPEALTRVVENFVVQVDEMVKNISEIRIEIHELRNALQKGHVTGKGATQKQHRQSANYDDESDVRNEQSHRVHESN